MAQTSKSQPPSLKTSVETMNQTNRTTPSASSLTETSSTSGTKRKREKDPKFYAVKTGFKPGVYNTWDECLSQVRGFKGATCKSPSWLSVSPRPLTSFVVQSFPTMGEAEDFMAGKKSTVSAGAISGEPQKFYAVASGRVPGVYTDWPSAQQQIVGWARPKHRKFSTRAEAEEFVKSGQRVVTASGPIPGFINGEPKDADGNVLEAGTGPLPPGAEDGFDPNILLDPKTGKVVYKTAERKSATKKLKSSSAGMLKIYTDGSSLRNGKAGAHAGVGVYFGEGDSR
jgi:ribonuclease HI